MKSLREQLEQARDEYQQVRYPGDLLRDVSRQRGSMRHWVRVAVPVAVAACLVIAIGWAAMRLRVEPSNLVIIPEATVIDTTPVSMETAEDAIDDIVVGVEAVNADIEAVATPTDFPELPTFSSTSFPESPSFPSWNAADSSEADKESI